MLREKTGFEVGAVGKQPACSDGSLSYGRREGIGKYYFEPMWMTTRPREGGIRRRGGKRCREKDYEGVKKYGGVERNEKGVVSSK